MELSDDDDDDASINGKSIPEKDNSKSISEIACKNQNNIAESTKKTSERSHEPKKLDDIASVEDEAQSEHITESISLLDTSVDSVASDTCENNNGNSTETEDLGSPVEKVRLFARKICISV